MDSAPSFAISHERSSSSRPSIETVKSYPQSRTTNLSSCVDIEKAHVRSSANSDFPWMAEEFEPIRSGNSRPPPQWFRESRMTTRNASALSGRSSRSGPRENFEDLGLIASDMDYYAGAVSDYVQQNLWNNDEDSFEQEDEEDGFGQIHIVRAAGDKRTPSSQSNRSDKDVNLVTWDGPDDPSNPKNWTRQRKWLATMSVSLLTFISPVSSSMIAPALPQIKTDLNISSELEVELALSVFILGFALGPLVLGPLSELFGRRPILLLSGLFYLIFNLAAGFAHNSAEVIAFRFLSGLGGSAPLGIGGGVLADIWMPHERGKAMAIYSLMPLLGPAMGPIAGGFITQFGTWRWVFWSTSIVAAVFILIGALLLRETYPATILSAKKSRLMLQTDNPHLLHTPFDSSPSRSFATHLLTALRRPFIMLLTQPIVQVLSLYIAYLFGVLYLVLASFPQVWTETYRQTPAIAGLNYISLGLGFFIGTQIAARFADRIYKHLKAKHPSATGTSEFRVPLMFPGAAMVPVGLLIYGWAAQTHTHWIVPNLGTAIFAAGNQLVFQNCQIYLVDAYTRYAASAIAATAVLRSLGGFAFPLFAPSMYGALGYGWGNTTLALLGVVIGVPVPGVLWWYGEVLRRKSTFAAG